MVPFSASKTVVLSNQVLAQFDFNILVNGDMREQITRKASIVKSYHFKKRLSSVFSQSNVSYRERCLGLHRLTVIIFRRKNDNLINILIITLDFFNLSFSVLFYFIFLISLWGLGRWYDAGQIYKIGIKREIKNEHNKSYASPSGIYLKP